MENKRDVFWQDLDRAVDGDLEGKVAIVTGGGKGIGRAIVESFLNNGAKVVIVTRESGKDLADGHENCYYKTCDVRDFKRVQEVVQETVAELGRLDILVNCAAYVWLTPVKGEAEEFFDKVMDINFKGVRNFIVAAAHYLEETAGCIISMGSIWGLPGTNLAGDSTYSAADAAIIKYSEVIAEELPKVRVNCISPALVETTMNDDMTDEEKREFVKGYEGRDTLLQPAEIAEVAEYIVKHDLTQKNIIIDAGYLKRSQ